VCAGVSSGDAAEETEEAEEDGKEDEELEERPTPQRPPDGRA
jgi:hypothetical protein